MTTIELIALLQRYERGGATGNPRDINLYVTDENGAEFRVMNDISTLEVTGAGDGMLGTDLDLTIRNTVLPAFPNIHNIKFIVNGASKPLSINKLKQVPSKGDVVVFDDVRYKVVAITWNLDVSFVWNNDRCEVDVEIERLISKSSLATDKHREAIPCDKCGDLIVSENIKYSGQCTYCSSACLEAAVIK